MHLSETAIDSSNALQVEHIELCRGRLCLAADVSFNVPCGRFVELHGPNGAGKSTLLRLLAGIQFSAKGQVKRQGGMALFASPFGLRRELTVAQQLQVSVSLHGQHLSLSDIKPLLAEVGLAHKALELTSRLSQGQRSRLGLCILKASRVGLWLMDEPVNALDEQGIALLARFLAAHLQAGGAAVVATHQSLPLLAPSLLALLHGIVHIGGAVCALEKNLQSAALAAASSETKPAAQAAFEAFQPSMAWVLKREWVLFNAAPKAAVWPAVFHAMVLCLFPIGLGSDVNLLLRVAAGLFWVSSLLACVLSASTVFEADYNEGALAQMSAAGLPLRHLALGKMSVAWLTQGGALALISGLLALQYRLPPAQIGYLMLSLAIGSGVLVHFSAFFGSMTLMAKQSSMLVYLLALPLFVPVLVFGTSVLNAVQLGQDPFWPLAVLSGLALLCVLSIPWLAAQLIAWALE
ncbi:MAG: heme exporter protein CcmB [Burkholderiales bacterium]|nr:heme exporter protein CcmB [Burkholderiales bacterium]